MIKPTHLRPLGAMTDRQLAKELDALESRHVRGSCGAWIWNRVVAILEEQDRRRNAKIRREGFVAGVKAAAAEAAQYQTTHPYRLDDCIECKLNVTTRKKPRRNPRRITP